MQVCELLSSILEWLQYTKVAASVNAALLLERERRKIAAKVKAKKFVFNANSK